MVIDNLQGPIKEAMVLGDCRTFPQLVKQAARMQRSRKRRVYHFPQEQFTWGIRQVEEYLKNPATNVRGYHHPSINAFLRASIIDTNCY